jgi:RNA recognition motif-containing protein
MENPVTLRLTNLPDTVTEEQVKDLFAKYGQVETVLLNPVNHSATAAFTPAKPGIWREDQHEYFLDGQCLFVTQPE